MTYSALWVAWLAMSAVVEIVAWPAIDDAIKEGALGVQLRRWFRIDTHIGRSLLIAVRGGFGVWFLLHILRLA